MPGSLRLESGGALLSRAIKLTDKGPGSPGPSVRRLVTRCFRALDRAENPLPALEAARALRAALDALDHALVDEARARGETWEAIAGALGTTRQSAHERFRG